MIVDTRIHPFCAASPLWMRWASAWHGVHSGSRSCGAMEPAHMARPQRPIWS